MKATSPPQIRFADRLARLGTETAFAVSAEAKAFGDEGNKVYPFHLGDINIKTPQTFIDAATKAMKDGKTGYCSPHGIPELRQALAQAVNAGRGTDYEAHNVVILPGGKPLIGKLIMALINPGEEVLYPSPGYPIYESQIEFHGARAVPYGFREGETNFEIDLERIEASITPKTRLLIYNNLQNPTGAVSSEAEMEKIAWLALEHDLIVLSDEAYFDIRFEGSSRSIASLPEMQDRTMILYTFSKTYAMTGWRLGGAIGPKEIVDVIAKLNVNDESCTTHFIQWAAVEGLHADQSGARAIVEELRKRRDIAHGLLDAIHGVRCFKPAATFYLFPNVSEAMARKGMTDYEEFRKAIMHATGVSCCTRAHFGRPLAGESEHYLRFAYSGISLADIEEGLGRLKTYLESD